MADCHDLFLEYLETIRLGAEKRKSLRTSRNANRERIREYFRDKLKREIPLFHGQGSYPMHTIITPEDCDYDLDDGVYLQGLGTDPDKWPVASTVHRWIVDATSGYTKDPPQDKNRCVRARYAAGYHIDLPIYAMNAEGKPLIFDKGADKPYESDPRAYTDWFREKVKEDGAQLRSIVRYLKAWRDHHRTTGAAAASGLGFTILVVDHYVADERDDIAFTETVKRVYTHMKDKGTIKKPTFPFEELTSWWDETKRANFLSKLESLKDRCVDAVEDGDKSVASKIWSRRVFGSRFPIYEPEENEGAKKSTAPLRTSAPAILGSDGRSA